MKFWNLALAGVKRVPLAKALDAPPRPTGTTISAPTFADLGNVVDMEVIRGAKLSLGVDPLGRRRASIIGDESPSAMV